MTPVVEKVRVSQMQTRSQKSFSCMWWVRWVVWTLCKRNWSKNGIKRWPDYWHADYWHADDWHADNWHGRQLACGKLAWRTIGFDFFNCFLFNYFNVLTNNKFHFQIKNLWTMLPYKQSYFRMTYENKFCYRIIYRIIFESIVFTYYIKSNGSLLVAHFA